MLIRVCDKELQFYGVSSDLSIADFCDLTSDLKNTVTRSWYQVLVCPVASVCFGIEKD